MLDFSDSSFSEFFAAELDIDIDDSIYAEHGGSKGKRLRCFLLKVDDATAIRTLQALWEHRTEFLARTRQQDPVLNAEGRYLGLLARLTGQPTNAGGTPPRAAFDWRLLAEMRDELVRVASLQAHERGYPFESERGTWGRFADAATAATMPPKAIGSGSSPAARNAESLRRPSARCGGTR